MRTTKLAIITIITGIAISVVLAGCDIVDWFNRTGTISLSLTDAPIADAADVEGVYITIESIEYNLNGEWITADTFTGPQKFNLLELTGGTVAPLADTTISAGTVSQIRFMLDAPEEGAQITGTAGCYIAIDPDGIADGDPTDDVNYSLFVPSGGQSGYKATGSFTVPANGTIEITADFDARKSVLYAGNPAQANGNYILQPTIKLVVNNQAGSIAGDFTDDSTDAFDSYIIFAYENDTYADSEATAIDDQSAPFPNSVGSATICDSDDDSVLDSYKIAFLAAGTYDLIVAGVADDGTYTVISQTDFADVEVTSETVTSLAVDLTSL